MLFMWCRFKLLRTRVNFLINFLLYIGGKRQFLSQHHQQTRPPTFYIQLWNHILAQNIIGNTSFRWQYMRLHKLTHTHTHTHTHRKHFDSTEYYSLYWDAIWRDSFGQKNNTKIYILFVVDGFSRKSTFISSMLISMLLILQLVSQFVGWPAA